MRRFIEQATTGAVALALGGTLLLSGCAATPEPAAEVTPTTAPAEAPAAAAEPKPDALVLPGCDTMNVTAQQEYESFGPEKFTTAAGATDRATFDEFAGAAARAAMDSAKQVQACRWPLHFEGELVEYAVELDDASRDALVEALRSDAGVTETVLGETVLGETPVFTYTVSGGGGLANPTDVTYAFVGNAWLALFDRAGAADYISSALDGLQAAHPPLFER